MPNRGPGNLVENFPVEGEACSPVPDMISNGGDTK